MRLRLACAFLLAACLALPAVPTPESHFGHRMGADRTVLDWDRVVSYFRALERSSARIAVRELGQSTEGRPLLVAVISAPETLSRLDRYRLIQAALADPRATPRAGAEPLIAQGKAVVMITCSIHASELASTHTAVEFAWRMLSGDSPRIRRILDHVILLLVPSLDPDGVDIVARWYRRTLNTPFEGTSPPELYQRYTGHDNNRDWYFFTQKETRLAVSALHNVWHPQIVYDVHQMGPHGARMFVPPWIDPVDPNVDSILLRECDEFGSGMAADLAAAGLEGVVTGALYDLWSPSRQYAVDHAGLRILSESASARLASPLMVLPGELDRDGLGYSPRERSSNYPDPWTGGEWRLRDIVDYQLAAWDSLLTRAAARREDLLRNFYRIGERAVARTSPRAFVVPAGQRDPGAARKLLETLAFGQVEVERAREEFGAAGKRYAAGSYVVRMQQPYSAFAKTLLERQSYPGLRQYPGGPPRKPYDVTAHTLPLLMGVAVDALEGPFDARLEPVTEFGPPAMPLSASDSDAWRALNRIWDAGGSVWRDPTSSDFRTAAPDGSHPLHRPRIGLYRSHVPEMDEGWTRWLLEDFGFRYSNVGNAGILAGGLDRRFDVIVFPDQAAGTTENGYLPGTMPEEFTGGLGEAGATALSRYLESGGTLVFLNRATEYAVSRLKLPLKSATGGLPASEFYSPGALLWARADRAHPLTVGLPERITVWSQAGPAWDIPSKGAARGVVTYPEAGILASGWLLGERYLAGKAAVVEIPVGKGRAVLFGIRPQYRAQSYQTFKLFFNALVR